MPEPVTTIATLAVVGLVKLAGKAGEAAAAAMGGAYGNTSDRVWMDVARGARDRVAGLRELPENHDVAKAVRTAQIQALERVIRDYRAEWDERWERGSDPRPAQFLDGSLAFCARAIGRWPVRRATFSLEVTAPLVEALDRALAPDGDASAPDRLDALVEDTVLGELTDALPKIWIPEVFFSHFRRGTASHPRYVSLFGAYLAEQVKSNARFRDIFVAGQLAVLKQFAEATLGASERVEARLAGMEAALEAFRLGDIVVRGGRGPHLTLSRYPKRRQSAAESARRGRHAEADLRLLDPFTKAMPLVGRGHALGECQAWLGGDLPVSVRGLVAPAGTGKTRLALELCDLAITEGWDAGFVDRVELARFADAGHRAEWRWEAPTLVVVDNAAEHAAQLHAWFAELVDNPGVDGSPLRVLLLDRAAEADAGWWAALAGDGYGAAVIRDLFDPPSAVPIPALAAPAERRAVFVGMLASLGAAVALPPEDDAGFATRLAQLSWGGEPLFLMMAALTAKKAGLGEALSLSRLDVAERVAGFEYERLLRFIPVDPRNPTSPQTDSARKLLAHLAAYATLCQGIPAADAREVIAAEQQALGLAGAGDAPVVYDWLRAALPGPDGAIAPIRPDAVGEAFVLQRLGSGGEPAAEHAVERAALRTWVPVAAYAIRLAQDYADAAARAAGDAGVLSARTLRWLDRLAAVAMGDLSRLSALAFQISEQTLVLGQRAVQWTNAVVGLLRQAATTEPDTHRPNLASVLTTLCVRLAHLGRRGEALAAAEEAVALWRVLAAAQPDAFRPELAWALNNLSNRLGELGRREAALAAIKEAVALRRTLAAAQPEVFRPRLARTLSNLSNHLGDVGRRGEALAAAEEAVALWRVLAAAQPDAFRPELAGTLNNLSHRLADVGWRGEALAAAEEAAALYRALAASQPDAFQPDLRMALNNLSVRLGDIGRRGEALAAIEEAVALCRALADAQPDTFRPELAQTLNNVSNRLADIGRGGEALAAIQEAAALHRALAAAQPDAFHHLLGGTLNNLSIRLSDLGRRDEALAAAEEALTLRRALAAAQPDAFGSDLAVALHTLSGCLSGVGRREAALAAVEEAVSLRRALAAAHPSAFEPDLARSLGWMSRCLAELPRAAAALNAATEGFELLAPHFLAHPAAFAELMWLLLKDYRELAAANGVDMQSAQIPAVIWTFAHLAVAE